MLLLYIASILHTNENILFRIENILIGNHPPGMDSPWKSVSCLKIMKARFAGCLRLICIAVAGLVAPLSRFLEGAPYKFLNEWMNELQRPDIYCKEITRARECHLEHRSMWVVHTYERRKTAINWHPGPKEWPYSVGILYSHSKHLFIP